MNYFLIKIEKKVKTERNKKKGEKEQCPNSWTSADENQTKKIKRVLVRGLADKNKKQSPRVRTCKRKQNKVLVRGPADGRKGRKRRNEEGEENKA